MTHEEKALTSVGKFIDETLNTLNEAIHGDDEDDARRFRGEWLRWMRLKATIRRDLAVDNEEYVEACRELDTLEGVS